MLGLTDSSSIAPSPPGLYLLGGEQMLVSPSSHPAKSSQVVVFFSFSSHRVSCRQQSLCSHTALCRFLSAPYSRGIYSTHGGLAFMEDCLQTFRAHLCVCVLLVKLFFFFLAGLLFGGKPALWVPCISDVFLRGADLCAVNLQSVFEHQNISLNLNVTIKAREV